MKKPSINNCAYKTYLIGSMEDTAKHDDGIGWRDHITPMLDKRNIYAFNPCVSECQKIGMSTKDLMIKLLEWQKAGEWSKFKQYMSKIWHGVSTEIIDPKTGEAAPAELMGDIAYVRNSDFLIWNHTEGDKPGGTIAELVIAWTHGIPVYLVTDMDICKMNKSLLFFLLDSGHDEGRFFKDFRGLFQYLDKHYNLKVK